MSRNEAVNWIINLLVDIGKIQYQDLWYYEHALFEIKHMLEEEPEQKTGKWVYNSPWTMKCNQCGLVIKDWDCHRFKFCPNCIAKMEVEE